MEASALHTCMVACVSLLARVWLPEGFPGHLSKCRFNVNRPGYRKSVFPHSLSCCPGCWLLVPRPHCEWSGLRCVLNKLWLSLLLCELVFSPLWLLRGAWLQPFPTGWVRLMSELDPACGTYSPHLQPPRCPQQCGGCLLPLPQESELSQPPFLTVTHRTEAPCV